MSCTRSYSDCGKCIGGDEFNPSPECRTLMSAIYGRDLGDDKEPSDWFIEAEGFLASQDYSEFCVERVVAVPVPCSGPDPKSRYYDAGGIETIDIIKAKLTPEQYEGYLLGNVLKYSCRMNFKGQEDRDKEKVDIYSKLLNELD